MGASLATATAAGAVLSLLRHPDWLALDTLYAEDGAVFLADAAAGSPIAAFGSSYAGYFHLLPRLFGAVAAALPASTAAVVMAVGAAGTTALLAVLVYVASADHLPSPLSRALVTAPMVVAPLAQEEIPNSVANLHWPALYAVFWMLVWTPSTRAGRLLPALVIAATALSDILVVAFLPLAVLRLAATRSRYSAWLLAVLAAGLLVQVAGLLTGASSRGLSPDPLVTVRSLVTHTVPATLFGHRWLPDGGAEPLRIAMAALAWLLLAAAVALAARRFSSPHWPLAGAAAAHAVLMHSLPILLTGGVAPRYAYVPALLLVVALVALLQPAPRGTMATPRLVAGGGRGAPRPLVIFAVLYALVCLLNFRVDTMRDAGPRWQAELEQAAVACASSTSGAVAVPITPAEPAWTAILPCDYVTGDR